ncbi:hypothetical protein PPTG_17751 [Phytophthora nicotianae INRA-310]|uniref:Uncharacterized protein n=1 Tax=Phytophthora nicotianae (strain INRA-310) TaxID=761204 RepID=W2PL91_PHYN3|nr:hypothetical protein PPTG_17751 [Phytophthora nicotianae INRA-310]ETN00780.1 hypothetical protein PPTG_17751 [Phytophthora nicotianae INRA-310]
MDKNSNGHCLRTERGGVGFEQALHIGIRDQFESAHIVGCLFYWKQAIRRKMISLGITRAEVAAAMEPGKQIAKKNGKRSETTM